MTTTTRPPTAIFTQEDVHSGPLRLVSARHPLSDEWGCTLESLAPVPALQGAPLRLAATSARMLGLLLQASGGEGCIRGVSGHRTRAEQAALFDDTLRERGEAYTRSYVALPGCSEHETGLAADLGEAGSDFVAPHFPGHGAFARLVKLAPLYGFVRRYPEGKRAITGIAPEPWHFRYVGWPHAALMQRHGWVLEEYIDELANRCCLKDALVHEEPGYRVHIFTLRPGQNERALYLPQGAVWQASGNNVDGVVVSLWE